MKEFKTIIINNRINTSALKKDAFEDCAHDYTNWKDAVEALRIAVSAWSTCDRNHAEANDTQTALDGAFDKYRKVLAFFTNKALGEKLKPEGIEDIRAIRDFASTYRKQAGSENGKDFLPVGAVTFRKATEDFIADRLTARMARTAEEIEAEKAKKQAEKKSAEKAKKQAEKKSAQTAA